MSNLALIAVLLRLVAIWLFVSVLDILAWGGGNLFEQPRFTILVLIKFTLAALFFFAPVWMARKLVPAEAVEESPGKWTPDLLQAVLFSAAGVWLLVTALSSSELTGAILFVFYEESSGAFVSVWSILVLVLKIVFGTWLLFGARGLVAVVGLARRARLDEKLP